MVIYAQSWPILDRFPHNFCATVYILIDSKDPTLLDWIGAHKIQVLFEERLDVKKTHWSY